MEIRPTLMEEELFRAAINGDIRVLSEANIARNGVSYYTNQMTPEKNNIIHIAAKYDRSDFIQEAISHFPELFSCKNCKNDTPLHVAARKGSKMTVDMLISYEGCTTEEESKAEEYWPWMVKNLEGDTPLHTALSNKKLNVAMDLLRVGSTIALSMVNKSLETPLHIFLRYFTGSYMTEDGSLEEGVPHFKGLYIVPGVRTEIQGSSSIIKSVLPKFLEYKPATCMRDTEGLTPLFIAAQRGCLLAMQLIIDSFPQCAEVCDPKRRTVLHHLNNLPIEDYGQDMDAESSLVFSSTNYKEVKKLLNVHEISDLKDNRDNNGNTPAHVAVENRLFVLVGVLVECFADFTIKNKDGVSALDLIKSLPDFANKMERMFRVIEKFSGKKMETELFEAAMIKGDVSLFERRGSRDVESGQVKYDDDYFLGRTFHGLSILHLAVEGGHLAFIMEAVKHFPALVLTSDLRSETPLHVAARHKNNHIVATTLLQLTKDCVDKFQEDAGDRYLYVSPWRQKNSKGDTPLHEALRSSNYDMAINLLNIDCGLTSSQNKAGETPLHILARYGTYTALDKLDNLVKLVIGQNLTAVHMLDAHGFTPLMAAAYCGRIRVAHHIIYFCPPFVQFRDGNGRTFLHHLRLIMAAGVDATMDEILATGKVIINYILVNKLRSARDQDGNTPLHFAFKNNNLALAKLLLQSCIESEVRQEMNMVDNEGHSVPDLLASLDGDTLEVKELKELALVAQLKLKETALGKKMMEAEVYSMAVDGDMDLFNDQSEAEGGSDIQINSSIHSKILSQAPDGSNILHLAIQHSQEEFVEEVLKRYPDLIFETDSNGDTPLHIAAKFYKADFSKLLLYFNNHCSTVLLELRRDLFIPPWRMKNSKGNTPLHEVLQLLDRGAQQALLNFAPEVTPYVNDAGETPLHVFARRGLYSPFADKIEILELLLSKNTSAVYMRDKEGLTPLLRAAKIGRVRVASTILEHSPQCIQLRDPSGRSFLHLLRFTGFESEYCKDDNFAFKYLSKPLLKLPEVDALRTTEDFEGNTPLLFAIKDDNSIVAKLLARRFTETDDELDVVGALLVSNNEGQSVCDLVASHDNAPNEVIELIRKKGSMNVGWIRSSYGVRRSQIKDMASTLSVVAGLLATLTFAAAFQVPGGYDGGDGSPLLLKRLAFQVFMISNTCAMCGSMVVLFSLLWLMSTGGTSDSFVLLDLSISILLLSFRATLLAFMTGVYAVVSHKALWLAIFVCALCSTFIIMMRKYFILRFTRFVRYLTKFIVAYKTFSWKEMREVGEFIIRRAEE